MRRVEIAGSDERLSLAESSLVDCIRAIESCPVVRLPGGSLEVAFVDEETCSHLHMSYFDDPEITDVMTFPGSLEDDHAGDIAICPLMASQACAVSGLSFREELSLYLVHACLHLSGLDDREEDDIKVMRRAEAEVMHKLRESGSLLKAEWNT